MADTLSPQIPKRQSPTLLTTTQKLDRQHSSSKPTYLMQPWNIKMLLLYKFTYSRFILRGHAWSLVEVKVKPIKKRESNSIAKTYHELSNS